MATPVGPAPQAFDLTHRRGGAMADDPADTGSSDEEEEKTVDTAEFLSEEWVEQPVAYLQRDLITYAVGIGCHELDFVYEDADDFSAFPTYPVVLSFKGPDQDVVEFPSDTMVEGPESPDLPGVRAGLDGERYIEKVRPLDPDGAELTLRSKIVGIHARGSGASVETEAELVDDDGQVLYRMVSGAFMVGATGFTDAGITHSERTEPPSRPPDAVEELQTSPHQALLYRLSGDYNPLHVSPDAAEAFGFETPILHGLCTLGFTARAVLKRYCGNDPNRWKAIKVRFAAPVSRAELSESPWLLALRIDRADGRYQNTHARRLFARSIAQANGPATRTASISAPLETWYGAGATRANACCRDVESIRAAKPGGLAHKSEGDGASGDQQCVRRPRSRSEIVNWDGRCRALRGASGRRVVPLALAML
eukprot:SAG22_NODE_1423_length_4464_cov_2.703551_3_plen_423_part_00